MPPFRRLLPLILLAAGIAGPDAAAAQQRVENTATLTYRAGTADAAVPSNTVSFAREAGKLPTRLSFRLAPAGLTYDNLDCRVGDTVAFTPTPIDADTLAAAPPLAAIDSHRPFILVLEAQGGNRDATGRETATIEIDAGDDHSTVTLQETAPGSGMFAGGIPADGVDDDVVGCDLGLDRGDMLEMHFREDEFSYPSETSVLIDPAGYVFDSTTGAVVDGALVTLLDSSGQPATVYGDDGVSRYPSTVTSGASVTDASGHVYAAIAGRYRFPLIARGDYTLRVVPPSPYVAPSVVTPAALAALTGPEGLPLVINAASYGGVLSIRDSRPFYADIPLDRVGNGAASAPVPAAAILLTKTASVRDAAPDDVIGYRIGVANRGGAVGTAIHLVDTLPQGLRYERGSTRGAAEPVVSDNGRELDFTIAAPAPGADAALRYTVTVVPGAPVGESVNRVRVRDGAMPSNEAAASVRVRPLLFGDAMTIIGRVTEGRCGDPADHRRGVAGVRLLLEDGTFVVTDRDGLYHLEGVRPGRHVVQLDAAALPASHLPVACDRDTRQAGSAISRFVEGGGGALARVDFQLAPTGKPVADTGALPIAVADDATAAGNRDWLAGQAPGVDWLFPLADHNPRAPALRVVVKHRPGQRVALSVNGVAADALSFDGSDTLGDLAVSRWTALPLVPGDNRLQARVLDADGGVAATLERVVHFSGAATRATLDPVHGRLVADGVTRPLIAVRVTDAAGRPVRAGTSVPFRVDAPYAAAIDADREQPARLDGATRAATVARVVGDDGVAFLALAPTTQAGAVHATVTLAEERQVRTSEVRAWLAAPARDWVVVGFGAGTLGYDVLDRHDRHDRASPRDRRARVTTDGQVALYAKGRVKGAWLLTIAYDSRRHDDPDRGLLGTIDPDRYYTVYGDGTLQGYDAPTRGKLYVRVERREAYALFGDLETGLTDAQLTRYSRTLHGAKAAYRGEHLSAVAVAARPQTRYGRDEIRGNGLSGPYRLSARAIVPNSDKLRIEIRDRYRAERIVSSRSLTRHLDYDIDALAGTVRFREPVLSRDAQLNPVFVVVDYEVEGNAGKLVAAARVAARTANGAVEVAVAGLRDEGVGARATVAGADVKIRLGSGTELRGEIAAGGRGGVDDGLAYLAEVEHHGDGIDLLGYVRRQDVAFGVGQQNLVEAGTRRVGFDARIALTGRLSLTATAWQQAQLDAPGRRVAGEARLEYRRDAGTFYLGGQVAHDRGLDGGDRDSRLLTLGATRTLLDGRLDLAAEAQVAPGGTRSSADFPARQQITAALRVAPDVRLIGGYEVAQGRDFTTGTARIGFDVAPWTGAKLLGTLNQQASGENGERTFAQYGFNQSLPLGAHWTIDATLDAASTLRGRIPGEAAVAPFQPAAVGAALGQDRLDGDYAALTLGAAWRAGRWSWNGRAEYRDADTADRWGATSNFVRTLGEGRTLASGIRLYQLRDATGATSRLFAADLALAWRPLDSRWSLLERLEWRHERADAGLADTQILDGALAGYGDDQLTTRVVNNLALNYRTGPEGAGHGLEATLYYGAKHVAGRLADERYRGFIDVTGFDLRRDIGHRLDIGVQASVQHAWERGVWTWSGGPSIGVAPAVNVWIGAGYNVAGYRDRDFEGDRHTRAGPYLTLRIKTDQQALRGVIGGGR